MLRLLSCAFLTIFFTATASADLEWCTSDDQCGVNGECFSGRCFCPPGVTFDGGRPDNCNFTQVSDAHNSSLCEESCIHGRCVGDMFLRNYFCLCEPGYFGSSCSETCGGGVDLTCDGNETITSPLYPQKYNAYHRCVWNVQAPSSSFRITVEIKALDVEDGLTNFGCEFDWLYVGTPEGDGVFKCGKLSRRLTTRVNENRAKLSFYSGDFLEGHGFYLTLSTHCRETKTNARPISIK